PALSKHAISEPAAGQIEKVAGGGIKAVNRSRLHHPEAQAPSRYTGGHEQNEQGARTVIAVALPHLGEKKGGQPSGMAKESGIKLRRSSGDGGIFHSFVHQRGSRAEPHQSQKC